MTAEVYKWRYSFRQTERLNFIKRVKWSEVEISVHKISSIAAPFASHKMQYEKWGINDLETSAKTTGIRPVDMPVDTLAFELSLED
jgi:hypothetical protein